jgi:hypothetical protein
MIDLKVIIIIHKTRTKTRSTTENQRTKTRSTTENQRTKDSLQLKIKRIENKNATSWNEYAKRCVLLF